MALARDRQSSQTKYGVPISAVSRPAGTWAGAITVRPTVSASDTSSTRAEVSLTFLGPKREPRLSR
jgi:hypothetical protein